MGVMKYFLIILLALFESIRSDATWGSPERSSASNNGISKISKATGLEDVDSDCNKSRKLKEKEYKSAKTPKTPKIPRSSKTPSARPSKTSSTLPSKIKSIQPSKIQSIQPSKIPSMQPSKKTNAKTISGLQPSIRCQTSAPTGDLLNVGFSPFSLHILTTSSRSLLETDTFMNETKQYLENVYTDKFTENFHAGFKYLTLSPACSDKSGTAVSSSFVCHFEGDAWFKSTNSIPPTFFLDTVNHHAFSDNQLFDYIAFLHESGDSGLLTVLSVSFSDPSDTESGDFLPNAEANMNFSLNGMYSFLAASASVAFGIYVAFKTTGERHKESSGMEPEIYIMTEDSMDDVSELSLDMTCSIKSKSTMV